jgi:hypothetical protein
MQMHELLLPPCQLHSGNVQLPSPVACRRCVVGHPTKCYILWHQSKHLWCSVNITASQAVALFSIPGGCKKPEIVFSDEAHAILRFTGVV